MHRSASASRVSEDLVVTSSSTSPPPSTFKPTTDDSSDQHLHLPTYDPLSHVAKRERRRIRSAENAIHIIPLLLVLCAIILWFFSNPVGWILLVKSGDNLIE
ncbi:unnamed protein product [Prunus armeniaca]|uniref:Transmembrane protein n=1 Tax=Prunus armeniaca TaxID=36596 RepID=A0A6J5UVN1_PRUAR|nr:unnamed protein product [Prunus armeniaca]